MFVDNGFFIHYALGVRCHTRKGHFVPPKANSHIPNILPGIQDRRAGLTPQAIEAMKGRLPEGFPRHIWQRQSTFYYDYWSWYTGEYLAEETDDSDPKNPTYKYPLRINSVVDFSRKLTSVLFGEAPDGPDPLVKTVVRPKTPLNGGVPTEEAKKKATVIQNAVNEVWSSSGGRALQSENGLMQQFLGGCFFQFSWKGDERPDLLIPIVVQNHPPDCVLPIWDPENPWRLIKCYVMYRIDNETAKTIYGVEELTTPTTPGFSIYMQEWSEETYSIYINTKPYTDASGTTYKDLPNPFGEVPILYIPRFREGNYYGPSIVDEVRGLVLELNSRLADTGDALQDAVHRAIFTRDLGQDPVPIDLDEDGNLTAIDLGRTKPLSDNPPDAFSINPPSISEALAHQPDKVWDYLLRAGSLGAVAYGEDEGSQRSGVTLEIRMWPLTSITRLMRTFWETGLNHGARQIAKMCIVKGVLEEIEPELEITLDDLKNMIFSQDWAGQIPRDRAQLVTEVLGRLGQNAISLDEALAAFGTRDIEAEKKRIYEDMETFLALQAKYAATEKTVENQSGDPSKSGVTKETVSPIIPSTEEEEEEPAA